MVSNLVKCTGAGADWPRFAYANSELAMAEKALPNELLLTLQDRKKTTMFRSHSTEKHQQVIAHGEL